MIMGGCFKQSAVVSATEERDIKRVPAALLRA
jgi:hypothetical protein